METKPHPSIRHDLSPKQQEFFYNSTAFMNIADGAVRSGKTHVCLSRFVIHSQIAPPGDLMILGRTRETIERNVISPMMDMFGTRRIKWNRGLGMLHINGRPVWAVGVNDAQAEAKIRGSTLAGSYLNEMTVLEERAFDQLVDRHSVRGARMFGDTNPDSPFHWLARKWLDNEDLAPQDLYRKRFALTDNPFLPAEYVARLKRAHSGMWAKRMVEGLWVVAEGAIFDNFDPESSQVVDILPRHMGRVTVPIDYGTSNATVFLKFGYCEGVWYIFDEYYYDARAEGRQKTDAEYADDFVKWMYPDSTITVVVDPSAASFKVALRKAGVFGVVDADNEVLDGIRTMAEMLSTGRLKIHRSCKKTIEQIATYSWDPKAQKKGEDKPLKQEDHCFVAGTPVETESGQRPIEQIAEGELVWTRYGLRPVVKTWHTPDRPLWELELSDGRTLQGTSNHPIYAEDKGFAPMDALGYGDIIRSWRNGERQRESRSSTRALHSGVIPMPPTLATSAIIALIRDTYEMVSRLCTGKCGRMLAGKYPRGITYITGTETSTITNSQTLSVCPEASTYPAIFMSVPPKSRERSWLRLGPTRQSGIGVSEAESGIASTVSAHGRTEKPLPTSASNVEPSTRLDLSTVASGSVPTSASRDGGEHPALTTSSENVLTAAQNSLRTSTTRPAPVHVVAVRPLEQTADVYNLTVAGSPEYFANGVLVHNCVDAARYGCMRVARRGGRISADMAQAGSV